MDETFDLLEYQQKARELLCPKKLFFLWEDVCRRYDRNEIGEYEFEEMKAVIWPTLKTLSSLRRIIDGSDQPPKKRLRRRA
ncbi:MAG: hypothetical protein C5B53_10650 [Candidatus Melainabacteria bacterium]|nr:MAG: hypothetical protein C5B53_10650 [Candidatus Melainabacteria bacterium]